LKALHLLLWRRLWVKFRLHGANLNLSRKWKAALKMNAHQRRLFRRLLQQSGFNAMPSQQLNKESTNKLTQQKQRTPLRRIFRLSTVLWTALLSVATLTGLWLFWPKVVIEPYASLDPRTPFAQQFYVENASIYSIYHVRPMCSPELAQTDQHPGFGGFSMGRKGEEAESLSPGGRMNMSCSIGFDPKFNRPTDNRISLVVWADYKLPIGFSGCKSVALIGKRTADQTFIWTYTTIPDSQDPCQVN
jgi:hypothetical protein